MERESNPRILVMVPFAPPPRRIFGLPLCVSHSKILLLLIERLYPCLPKDMPISFPKGGGSAGGAAAAAKSRTSTTTSSSNNNSRPHHHRPERSLSSVSSTSASSSSIDSSSSYDSDDEDALVREEWEESLRQMQALVSLVLLPFFGKWWGRRWSYWGESPWKRSRESTRRKSFSERHTKGLGGQGHSFPPARSHVSSLPNGKSQNLTMREPFPLFLSGPPCSARLPPSIQHSTDTPRSA